MAEYGYLLPTRGIVLSSEGPDELRERTRETVPRLARYAEDRGFGAGWVGDSVVAKPRLEPMTTLSAVAAATEDMTLGTAVYLPNLRHAINVAHQTATVDQISGGRLQLGVGVGIGPDVEREHEFLSVPYERRGARLDEGLDVITKLWSGEPIDHDGSAYDVDGASIGFGPADPPPILLASTGFDPDRGFPRRIRERIAAHAGGWLPLGLAPEEYETGLEEFRRIVDDAGRDPSEIVPAFYLDTVVRDSEEEALADARRFLRDYYTAWDDISDEEIRARGAFGSLERLEETLRAYEERGVESFVIRFIADDQREHLDRVASLLE